MCTVRTKRKAKDRIIVYSSGRIEPFDINGLEKEKNNNTLRNYYLINILTKWNMLT